MKILRSLALWLVCGVAAAAGVVIAADPADTRLAEAAQKSDLATVRALLRQKADVNGVQPDGMTALLWAGHNGQTEIAALLVAAGADVSTRNRYGVTPLSEAAATGNAALLDLLLKAGANPNGALLEGDTPLMHAARTGNVAAVKILLAHGANVNARDNWHGESALTWAVGANHADVVRVLIEHGVDVNAATSRLEWPTTGRGPARGLPTGELTPLMIAARENAYEAAEALLAAGADTARRTSPPQSLSILRIAVQNANWDFARLLVEHGADANEGALPDAVTVLKVPRSRSVTNRPDTLTNLGLINYLLDRGTKPDSIATLAGGGGGGLIGFTVPADAPALFRAAAAADVDLMRALDAKGADATRVLADGTTAMMLAVGVGAARRGGAVRDNDPADDEIISALDFLLSRGVAINATHADGVTVLHGAAAQGRDTLVRYLVDKGASVNARDRRGRTPLDAANGVLNRRPILEEIVVVHESTVALLRTLGGQPGGPAPEPPPAPGGQR